MDHRKIISLTGLSGLYELLSSKSDGAVVRSLEDKTTKFVSSRNHSFSHLESIEVYTVKENITLAELFKIMKQSNEPLPDAKADGKQLRSYFEKIYSDMDFERVYTSDMKKMVKWFNILQQNNIELQAKDEKTNEETSGVIEETKDITPVPEEESLKNSK